MRKQEEADEEEKWEDNGKEEREDMRRDIGGDEREGKGEGDEEEK